MSNLITDRVAYFLKDFPPFSFLEYGEIERIAGTISVKYVKKAEHLFKQGQKNTKYCYILRQGNVKLYQQQMGNEILVDQCEPGDVFGVRSILSGNPYVMSAEAFSESLVYALPADQFKELLEHNQRFSLFFASGYAAGQAVVRGGRAGVKPSLLIEEEHPLVYSKKIIVCDLTADIKSAAMQMAREGVGSIIVVDPMGLPTGIVTDSDLRCKVVAEGLSSDTPVNEVMTKPVVTVSPNLTITEVQMQMIESGIHHLLITEDGTDQTAPVGLVSDHDVLLSRLNHPSVLLKAIKNSDDEEKWAEIRNKAEEMLATFIDQEISITLVSNLISRINDLIIQKAVRKYAEGLDLENIRFCWLGLGSEGREEQLLRTDQDNAILFEDGPDNKSAQKRLLELAEKVNEVLIRCGFEECPADIMARNPKWCQPLSVWKNYFSDWVRNPDPKSVMHTTIFFDFRPVYGHSALADSLAFFLRNEISKQDIFLNYLAKNATQNPPPLSFFNNLVLERSGTHAREFDIKKRGMMPLADSARVLSLQHGLDKVYGTLARFKALQAIEPMYADLMAEAGQSYEIMMRYRAKSGLRKGDSGRYIEISELNKLEKQILKNAFQSIKELQEILDVRFKLAYFS